MGLSDSERELIQGGFRSIEKRLDRFGDKMDAQRNEIVEATRVANGAKMCAVTARDIVDNHIKQSRENVKLLVKWILGVIGTVAVGVVLAWLKLHS
jgi:hypothetical protein